MYKFMNISVRVETSLTCYYKIPRTNLGETFLMKRIWRKKAKIDTRIEKENENVNGLIDSSRTPFMS